MPDKVLLVCSSTATNIQKAREILCGRTSSDRPELHLLCSPSDLPYLHKEPPAGRVWVFPHRRELGKGFRLWLKIRRQRYREVAVLWCGDAARRRPKLFALACGGSRILVFDQRLQCAPLRLSLLGRLLIARLRRLRPPVEAGPRAAAGTGPAGAFGSRSPARGRRVAFPGAMAADSGSLSATGRVGNLALRPPPASGGTLRKAGSGSRDPPPHQPSPFGSASATPPQGGSDRVLLEALCRPQSLPPGGGVGETRARPQSNRWGGRGAP